MWYRLRLPATALAVAALFFAPDAFAAAGSHTFRAAFDAHVSAAAPARSFSRSAVLRVRGRPVARSYLRFDVTGLGGGVQRATLRLYVVRGGSGFWVRRVRVSADERRLTYLTAPALGGRVAFSGPMRAGEWLEVDVTRLVRSDGVVRLGLTSPARRSVGVASRNSARAPQLVVETADSVGRVDGLSSSLDNGIVRVAVDLSRGGVITYLAPSGGGENLINNHDLGRQVQQSYYSGPRPYGNPAPPWDQMPWNPIGTGDTYGNPSEVLTHSNDGTTIYVKSTPKQWALNNVPCECNFEHWITLNGAAVEVRNRLNNSRSDTTQYPGHTQELPAVYVNGPYHRAVAYTGTRPYSGEPVSQIEPLLDGARFLATERWTALVNDGGWGLGVFHPEVETVFAKFFGTRGSGSTSDFTTGYVAPNAPEVLDHNISYEFEYALILGSVDEIRGYALAHRPAEDRSYSFEADREHWTYVNATDGGWPIQEVLRVDLSAPDPMLKAREALWSAAAYPKLYIRAAYHRTTQTTAQLFWAGPGEGFAPQRSVSFPIVPDGQFRTYEVDLSAAASYVGPLTRLRFDPVGGGQPGSYVEVDEISTTPIP